MTIFKYTRIEKYLEENLEILIEQSLEKFYKFFTDEINLIIPLTLS